MVCILHQTKELPRVEPYTGLLSQGDSVPVRDKPPRTKSFVQIRKNTAKIGSSQTPVLFRKEEKRKLVTAVAPCGFRQIDEKRQDLAPRESQFRAVEQDPGRTKQTECKSCRDIFLRMLRIHFRPMIYSKQ